MSDDAASEEQAAIEFARVLGVSPTPNPITGAPNFSALDIAAATGLSVEEIVAQLSAIEETMEIAPVDRAIQVAQIGNALNRKIDSAFAEVFADIKAAYPGTSDQEATELMAEAAEFVER